MKQYRFRLQTVLDYRAEQLNRAQQRVAEEEKKRLDILQRIQEYDAAIEQALLEQQQAVSEARLDPVKIRNFPNYLWRLKQFRFQEHQLLLQQEQRLALAREELKQALIRKKSLDVLKDKDYARYRKKIEKAEEEFLAELALNRKIRQANG